MFKFFFKLKKGVNEISVKKKEDILGMRLFFFFFLKCR